MAQKPLKDAIHNKEIISFTYLGVDRVVEPYLLGLNADGQITLCAWQMSDEGGSGWKDYLIDKIRNAAPTDLYFRKTRTDCRPKDFSMKHILAWVGTPKRNLQDLFF
jgi:predicted DNA-binding transcriptional regulator YafY